MNFLDLFLFFRHDSFTSLCNFAIFSPCVLPRSFPPGQFLFLVPISGHPSRAVPGGPVVREPLSREHAQELFLTRRLPRIRTTAAEVHRFAASPHLSQLLQYIQFHVPRLPLQRGQGRRCGYFSRSLRSCSHVVRPASSGEGKR